MINEFGGLNMHVGARGKHLQGVQPLIRKKNISMDSGLISYLQLVNWILNFEPFGQTFASQGIQKDEKKKRLIKLRAQF